VGDDRFKKEMVEIAMLLAFFAMLGGVVSIILYLV
jgi:hypothetical protein